MTFRPAIFLPATFRPAPFRPAFVAGLVGIGIGVILVISFELIFAVQLVVFLLALPLGLLIGWYANVRDRDARAAAAMGGRGGSPGSPAAPGVARIGWLRALANALIATGSTAVVLAVLYVLLRLLFLYLDTGFVAGGTPYQCASGPDCGYQRALDEPQLRDALAGAGVHDAAGYTAFFLEGQAFGAAALVLLVSGGGVVGAIGYRLASSRPRPSTIAPEGTL